MSSRHKFILPRSDPTSTQHVPMRPTCAVDSSILGCSDCEQVAAKSAHVDAIARCVIQDTSVPPDLRIDPIGKGKDAWLRAVEQWEIRAAEGILPLKSWEPHWYQGGMARRFGVMRSQRKTIAEEFARYNYDKDAFLRAYPMASKVSKLLTAIRCHHGRRRASFNGTPEERDRESGAGPSRTFRVHSYPTTDPY